MSNGEERRQRREEIVWRLYNEGWFAGNLDLMRDLLDPGIVWTAIEDAPDAGTYRGYEGVNSLRLRVTFGADERLVAVNEYATREEALAAAQMEP